MSAVTLTPYQLAERFLGITEHPGLGSNPIILAMLQLDQAWPTDDDVPWCSALPNYICHLLSLPRSRSLVARSWLDVGEPIRLDEARPDADLVILARGSPPVMDPANRKAPGHVGFYQSRSSVSGRVTLLGGNHGNVVSLAKFPIAHILGVRRLN